MNHVIKTIILGQVQTITICINFKVYWPFEFFSYLQNCTEILKNPHENLAHLLSKKSIEC